MKVELIIKKDIIEPYAIIYSNELTDEVSNVINKIKNNSTKLSASLKDKIYILKPKEIYLIKVLEGKLEVYDKSKQYIMNKRLYEVKEILTNNFIQISKGTIINVDYVESVEVSFSGTLKVKLKNELQDYISRSYVKKFKEYLEL
ncbi:LytTR family DNA-binding domain-containing protein [Haploplasma axanthum]|uniref:Two-component response regulator n=1 Tax=Haploplasma axanthum TaxID=29552 RepID=A0A449BDU1_HAPAX|nr:LytTR family DNA-binding domain-containing protein [Haploplasma axanthum]VEU80598.1 two-component response regulator [Haploplasma axanthum]